MNGEPMIRTDVQNAVQEAFCVACYAPANEWRSHVAAAPVILEPMRLLAICAALALSACATEHAPVQPHQPHALTCRDIPRDGSYLLIGHCGRNLE